jgi:hypothetical protein
MGAGSPPARVPARQPGQSGQDGAPACTRTSPPARSIWPRWRASVHSSAGGALRTRIAKQVRATLGVTHLWTDIVAHAFSRAFRKPVLCCRGPDTFAAWSSGEHKSWRRSLRQEALSQPTAAAGRCMMVSHATRLRGFARLFQAKRPHLASCQGRSSTEDELCGESDWNSCAGRGCWRRSR